MTKIPLRERKYAKTKSDLMKALVSRLDAQTLDEIAVKDVCHDVQVSETTFFNYFPSKQDVITYFVQLWSIDIAWSIQLCLQDGGSHLDAIQKLFDRTVESETQSPGIMAEVVAYQARNRKKLVYQPLTRAEYAQHFPDREGIAQIEGIGVDALMLEQLTSAKQKGELDETVDLQALWLTLMSIFFVTPVLVGFGMTGNLRQAYQSQVDQLLLK